MGGGGNHRAGAADAVVVGADRLLLNVSCKARGWRRGAGNQGDRWQEDRRREDGDCHFASEEEEMGSPNPFCVQVSTNSSDSYFHVRGQLSNINQNKVVPRARPVLAPLFLEGSGIYCCQPLGT